MARYRHDEPLNWAPSVMLSARMTRIPRCTGSAMKQTGVRCGGAPRAAGMPGALRGGTRLRGKPSLSVHPSVLPHQATPSAVRSLGATSRSRWMGKRATRLAEKQVRGDGAGSSGTARWLSTGRLMPTFTSSPHHRFASKSSWDQPASRRARGPRESRGARVCWLIRDGLNTPRPTRRWPWRKQSGSG